ncbi:MAG: MoxR family ATPase, partial [Clostridia bacterium]
DVLYFLSQSFRAQLLKELPAQREHLGEAQKKLAHRAKALLKELAAISMEIAQMVVSRQNGEEALPGWFMVEIVRDLPRLVDRKEA